MSGEARGIQGQTLIELIMATTLISILAVGALTVITDTVSESRFDATRVELLAIRKALVGDPTLTEVGVRSSFGYQGDVGGLPSAAQGLSALWTQPAGVAAYAVNAGTRIGLGWNGPYLNSLDSGTDYTKDAWGNALVYNPTASPPTITSYGADGAAGGTGLNQDIAVELPANVLTATVNGVVVKSGAPWSGSADIALNEPNGSGGMNTLSTSITAANNGAFSFSGVPIGIRSVTVYVPDQASPTTTLGPIVFSITGNQYLIPTNLVDLAHVNPNLIAFRQQTTAGNTTASTLSFSAITVTGGSALILQLAIRDTPVSAVSSITDSNQGTSTWQEIPSFPSDGAGNNLSYDIWYALNHPAGSTTITIQLSATADGVSGNLSEFSGVATSNAVDSEAKKVNASTTTALTGLITTINANDLVLGGAIDATNTNMTALTEYGAAGGTPTALTNFDSSAILVGTDSVHGNSAYQIVTATGSYGMQWTSHANNEWAGIVAFKSQ